jgi:hypothetical protein
MSVLSATIGLAVTSFSAASPVTVPNPCTLVSAATVAATVGLTGVTLTGKSSERPDGPVKQSVCSYTHGSTLIQILVAPHQPSGGSSGPPGMKTGAARGLGTGAVNFYDTSPQYAFANISFTKAGLDGGARDTGTLPDSKILALARLVYKALG